MYEDGKGIYKDSLEAERLYRKAAKQGLEIAKKKLEGIYSSNNKVYNPDYDPYHMTYWDESEMKVDVYNLSVPDRYKITYDVSSDLDKLHEFEFDSSLTYEERQAIKDAYYEAHRFD